MPHAGPWTPPREPPGDLGTSSSSPWEQGSWGSYEEAKKKITTDKEEDEKTHSNLLSSLDSIVNHYGGLDPDSHALRGGGRRDLNGGG